MREIVKVSVPETLGSAELVTVTPAAPGIVPAVNFPSELIVPPVALQVTPPLGAPLAVN
jgi:hypothetical protein